jgi:hypothetical protein
MLDGNSVEGRSCSMDTEDTKSKPAFILFRSVSQRAWLGVTQDVRDPRSTTWSHSLGDPLLLPLPR